MSLSFWVRRLGSHRLRPGQLVRLGVVKVRSIRRRDRRKFRNRSLGRLHRKDARLLGLAFLLAFLALLTFLDGGDSGCCGRDRCGHDGFGRHDRFSCLDWSIGRRDGRQFGLRHRSFRYLCLRRKLRRNWRSQRRRNRTSSLRRRRDWGRRDGRQLRIDGSRRFFRHRLSRFDCLSRHRGRLHR